MVNRLLVLSRAMAIVNQMHAYGEQISNETIVAKMLRSLTLKFDLVVAAIEEAKDLSVLSVDELMGSLQAHESRINRSSEKNEEKALQVKETATNQGENVRASRGRGRGGFRGSRGHGNSRVKNEEEEEERLFMACIDSNPKPSDLWFVDSGYLNHMTGTKSLSQELDETQIIKVQLGNIKEMQVEGKCMVKVETERYNLLSVGQLMAGGHSILFDDNTCVITNKKLSRRVQIPMTLNKMFPLDVSNMENFALAANAKDDSMLWHLRYGHLHMKGLKLLSDKENVIQRELTAPYTPEQNGIAERKNQTVVEMARSMLQARRLANQFWAEAVATFVYLLNLSSRKVVMNRTPYKAWHGRKPSVSHLRVFRCVAYALINS
ncbi:uncharacterized protein LOC119370128 [Jatropha curcas]|uniref:uncharacterized protein LOC119370128 n=1 Tax=Jatropha curcas TaxID=180498 RepID=UPI001893BB81|nr:uncharacterized protein LOC119370128 [Jatropha curcas]